MILLLGIAAILSIGLMIGVEFSVSAFINPILWKLNEEARTQAVRHFAATLGKVMPFWYAGNFLLLLIEAFVFRGRAAFILLATGSGVWAAVIVLTLIFLVPINNRLVRNDSALSIAQAHRQHQRWDAMHRARVVALATAFVLLLFGVHG